MARFRNYGRVREEGLPDIGASATVPSGYGAPTFGTGNAAQAGLNPDQTLLADSVPEASVDPNAGFSVGGADDPLAEDFDNSVALGEDGMPIDDIGSPVIEDDSDIPVMEDDDGIPVMEDDMPDVPTTEAMQFEDIADIPPFDEDDSNNPDLNELVVDEDGIVDPMVVPSETEEVDPELGTMPEAELPMEEPIVQVDEDDVEVQIPEDAMDSDMPEPIEVVESFVLPENKEVVISKGDKIFVIGKIKEGYRPSYAESVFARALRSLCESVGVKKPTFSSFDRRCEKVALVGRSILVEAACDWRIPGTDKVVEKHDLIQIVSARPLYESPSSFTPVAGGASTDQLKMNEILAYRRWRDAKARRTEAEKRDAEACGKKESDDDKKPQKEEDDEKNSGKKESDDDSKSDSKKDDDKKEDKKSKKESAYL